MLHTYFQFIWSSGFRGEDSNVKSSQMPNDDQSLLGLLVRWTKNDDLMTGIKIF
jgi:hypothetical protein